jgi:hypothetical protein
MTGTKKIQISIETVEDENNLEYALDLETSVDLFEYYQSLFIDDMIVIVTESSVNSVAKAIVTRVTLTEVMSNELVSPTQ